MPAEINYYDKDMMKNPLSPKRTHASVPANMCVDRSCVVEKGSPTFAIYLD
jgi:hypothetical protein